MGTGVDDDAPTGDSAGDDAMDDIIDDVTDTVRCACAAKAEAEADADADGGDGGAVGDITESAPSVTSRRIRPSMESAQRWMVVSLALDERVRFEPLGVGVGVGAPLFSRYG